MALQKKHDYAISKKASQDIENAFDWYEKKTVASILRLGAELQSYISKIRTHPYMYKHITNDVQRCLMKTFPYIIFYSYDGILIVILRVRHKKQKPLKRFK